jgi:hypothetical protein
LQKVISLETQMKGGSYTVREVSLLQVAEGLSKTIINATDQELEAFQKVIQESLKLREGHKNLHKLIQNFSGKNINVS